MGGCVAVRRKQRDGPDSDEEEGIETLLFLIEDTHDLDCDCQSCRRVSELMRRGLEEMERMVQPFPGALKLR